MATNVMMVRNGTIKLGPTATATAVECQITNATISATPDPKELTTVCGKVTVPGITAYVLNLEGAQDWTEDTGVSHFLFSHDGELVDFEITPTSAASPKASGKLYVSPGDFGGVSGEIAVFSVSLGLEGAPTITPSTAAPLGATAGAPVLEPEPA